MKKLLTSTAVIGALTVSTVTHTKAAIKKSVTFESQNQMLAGDLYLPDDYQEGDQLPGVIVTGSWTSVKEQMSGAYAEKMANRGYVALAFDFRGWGESAKGTPDLLKFVEHPGEKTKDILAATDFMATLPQVDSTKLATLGICASAGYAMDAAHQSEKIRATAAVAPWLHDKSIIDEVYGQNVPVLMEADKTATILEAASDTNENAVMYQAAYYTDPERGAIAAYDNKFSTLSWKPWLSYDAIQTAAQIQKPVLLVHSDAAAIPQGARKFAANGGDTVTLIMLDDITQFDFYDAPEAMKTAVQEVDAHFRNTFGLSLVNADTMDEAAIKTIIESVAVFADTENFEALEQLYMPEIEVDYTSLTGGEIELKSPQDLMTQWASVLPGFERTRHTISNIKVSIHGQTAVATADVVADHWVDDLFWQVTGAYRYKLVKHEGRWLINAHQLSFKEESGTRDVFRLATEYATANPAPYSIRQQAQQVVRTFLTSLEAKDMETFATVWAEDAVQEMPYALEGFPECVKGKENLIKHHAAWPENSGNADFTSQLIVYHMQNSAMIFAEFKGDVDIIPTGRKYKQQYGGLFHIENGKIKRFREYFNPMPFKYAFGLDDDETVYKER